MHLDVYEPSWFKLVAIIDTTETAKTCGPVHLRKFSIDLDGIWSAVETCWSDEPWTEQGFDCWDSCTCLVTDALTTLLTVPRFSLGTFGKRSVSVFGPTVWNSLRLSLRKTQCFATFKKKLKTHLFQIYLCWSASVSFCIYHSGGVCVCMCVCVMVGAVFVFVDTVYGFLSVFFLMLSWMFQHAYLDTYCFECLICMCFVFLYLHLFSAIEHVSHGKAL